MKTWLECVKEAATSEGWITGQDFINAQSENTLDVFSVAAKMYHEQSNSHKQVVMQAEGSDGAKVATVASEGRKRQTCAWVNYCSHNPEQCDCG